MIGMRVPGWSRVVRGERVRLIAPEGPEAGIITLRERVRPLAHLAEVLRGRVEARGVQVIEGPVPIVSLEGEQGVFITIEGELEGALRQRDVGLLVGDEFFASVIGITSAREHFARTSTEVRRLVERFPMWLGVRRRLLLYPPPRGWRGVARGLEADWHAPGFPRDPARMTVFPATPARGASAEEALATLIEELDLDRDGWTEGARRTPPGLTFQLRASVANGRVTRLAVAADAAYLYAVRLETSAAADHAEALEAILDGMAPVPPTRPAPWPAMAHWVD